MNARTFRKIYIRQYSEIYRHKTQQESIPSSYTCHERSIYIDSKKLGETILFKSLKKESFYVFRICLVYSDIFKSTDRRVLYDFVRKAIKFSEIKLLDNGKAMRQYLHINDCINMMFDIISHYQSQPMEYSAPIFNISNPDPISILDLAGLIGKNLGANVIVPEENKNSNPLSALQRVSVLPARFLDIFPDYKFMQLEAGIQDVCRKAQGRVSNE